MNLTKPDAYFLNASLISRPFTVMIIDLKPCYTNLTDSSNRCSPDPSFLQGVGVIAHKLQVSFDPSNKKEPTSYYIDNNEIYALDLTKQLDVSHFIRKTEIFDDDIDFYGSYRTKSYLELDSSTSSRIYRLSTQTFCKEDGVHCNPYIQMVLRASSKTLQITRQYKFLVTTLADLGGFFDIMVLIAGISFGYCTTKSYEAYIRNNFMRMESTNYSKILKEEDKDKIYGLMDEVIEETQDGLSYYKQSARQQFIDRVLFEEYHIVLIPLVLILEKKIQDKKDLQNSQAKNKESKIKLGKGGRSPHQLLSSYTIKEDLDSELRKQSISVDEAIERLHTQKSESSLGQMIDSYMIEVLQEGLGNLENAHLEENKRPKQKLVYKEIEKVNKVTKNKKRSTIPNLKFEGREQ